MHVDIAGVSCSGIPPTSGVDPTNDMRLTKTIKDNSYLIVMSMFGVLLIMSLIVVIRYTIILYIYHILKYIFNLRIVLLPTYSSRDLTERETFIVL